MRSFTSSPSRTVSLSNGAESVEFTVKRPPLLFHDILNRAFPIHDDDNDGEKGYRLSLRVVLIAAEGIRATEGLPPRPEVSAGEAAWQAHAEEIAQIFSDAGLLDTHLNQLAAAVRDLQNGKVDGKAPLAGELDRAGND